MNIITAYFFFIHLFGFLNLVFCNEELRNCRTASTYGYGYDTYYEVKDGISSSKQYLTLEFKVKAKSDAHVLLSASNQNDQALQAYEIVIGGGKNSFSQIRILKKGAKSSENTQDIVSDIEYRSFWISINHTSRVISVGRKGETDSFIFWKYDVFIPVKYFAFSTWVGVKGNWVFGCQGQNDLEFVEVEKNYTGLQRLRRDLLESYDAYRVPVRENETLIVKLSFQTYNVHLDEKKAQITIDGVANLKWTDEYLGWNPENYDGISTQFLSPYHIWTPNIKVLSGLQYDYILDLTKFGVIVQNSGEVFWRPHAHFTTFCDLNIQYWPHDTHNCSVFIGFWMEQPNLLIDVVDDKKLIHEDRTGSEWEVLDIETFNLSTNNQSESSFNQKISAAIGIISFVIRRRDSSYNTILLCPFIAGAILTLASFWLNPSHSGQIFLSCSNIIILGMMLMDLANRIPVMQAEVPNIVLLYSWGMVFNCIPLLLAVYLKHFPSFHIPEQLSALLNNSICKAIFFLPGSVQNQTIYSHLHENQQEQEKLNEDRINVMRLAVAIERIFFVIFLSIFAYSIFLIKSRSI